MSDYTQITDFSVKDGLTTGDPEKAILGADVDAEFAAIATAISSKYDSNDIASQAQAEALALDTVLITPHNLNDVLVDNAGILKDLQQLADPGGDRLVMWDDSDNAAEFATLGSGISITTNAINIDHDAADNFVANEHIDHTSVDITAGTGLTGGGDISASRTLNVVGGDGITANANDIALTDAAASATNPIDISSGTVSFDGSGLTGYTGAAAVTDSYLYLDDGVLKQQLVQDVNMRVQTSQST